MTTPAFPRERLLASIREAAKRASRGERLVILHEWEARDVVAAFDAEKAAREKAEAMVETWHVRAEAALREAQERLDRIDAFAGERCEASGCRADPCGPVEYHDVDGVPLCAECWQECLDEAAQAQEKKEVPCE